MHCDELLPVLAPCFGSGLRPPTESKDQRSINATPLATSAPLTETASKMSSAWRGARNAPPLHQHCVLGTKLKHIGPRSRLSYDIPPSRSHITLVLATSENSCESSNVIFPKWVTSLATTESTWKGNKMPQCSVVVSMMIFFILQRRFGPSRARDPRFV